MGEARLSARVSGQGPPLTTPYSGHSPSSLLQVGTGAHRAANFLASLPQRLPTPGPGAAAKGGGGGSELPAAQPGQEGAEPPSRRAGGRVGREPRGCGEELGEGSEEERRAWAGERGAGAARRREVGLERARAREEPPGRRGGRRPELGWGSRRR